MMLKFLPLTALALGLSGGVALADRGHSGDHRVAAAPQHSAVVRDHREWNGGRVVVRGDREWRGGGRGFVRNDGYRNDGYRREGYRHIERRPIFVSRPVIRGHYYDYYRRPALIVESYGPTPGYYWVGGGWAWDGAEWIWQPGHYQPDPNYIDQGYGVGVSVGY